MVGRDPFDGHRLASALDLLYALTVVASFSQAGDQPAHFVATGHSASAFGAFLLVVLSVCWAWTSYTWFASAFDSDDWFHRVRTMIQMVGVVIVALGIPPVFESIDAGQSLGYSVFAANYVSCASRWCPCGLVPDRGDRIPIRRRRLPPRHR